MSYCDKCEEVQDEDQEDFASGEPEFSFTIGFDSQDVARAV